MEEMYVLSKLALGIIASQMRALSILFNTAK